MFKKICIMYVYVCMPLGKLKRETVLQGYRVLQQLADLVVYIERGRERERERETVLQGYRVLQELADLVKCICLYIYINIYVYIPY